MAENDQTNRRLAAILAADVVGYSRLMGADEAGTLAALKRHRETVFDPTVARHKGRVVKLIGDGTLVEFASVVDAVNCALAIQRAVRTASQENGGPIQLRIGINLGDIIIDGDDIYGDGVNIAARLEPLAEPGGVCVAAIVNDSVGNRIDVTFRDGGEVAVKNIARPIRVWKWHPDHDLRPAQTPAKPAVAKEAAPAETVEQEPPSIAVLPFDNMSGDPEQEYFSDGITEDIITDLSKIAGLLVIARNSSFTYKGKSVDIRAVGRELGVRSVLEGSIRRAGNRVRINAQLINAVNGGHVWAERYDRDLTDIFAVQDEVTRDIVEALKVKLTPREAARVADTPTKSPGAARSLSPRPRIAGRPEEQPGNVRPGGGTAGARHRTRSGLCRRLCRARHGAQSRLPEPLDGRSGCLRESRPSLRTLAAEKGPNVPYARFMAAVIAFWSKDLPKAKSESEAALSINPNYAMAFGTLALVEMYSGNPLAAVPLIERAMRLDPAFTHQTTHFLGSAHLIAGNYSAAVAAFRERIRLSPGTDFRAVCWPPRSVTLVKTRRPGASGRS